MAYVKSGKQAKFSHTKVESFCKCGWRYKLTYIDGHSLFSASLANELGTLIHYIEEHIFKDFMNKEIKSIDYEAYKTMFKTINIPKKDPYDPDGGVYGIDILKEKYKEDFYRVDSDGNSYYKKTIDYMTHGIYRLEEYLKDHPGVVPFAAEKFFSITLHDRIFSGYIDRIFYDEVNDMYIIEDIKTKDKPFKDDDLTTPMQFVIYTLGLAEALDIDTKQIYCRYDLPILDLKQDAGTPGYVKRGQKKLADTFAKIDNKEYVPNPTPLCYWCDFSRTNPKQPEAGKNLCPYYSMWTPDMKDFSVANKWEGMENHDAIMQREINQHVKEDNGSDIFDFDF